MRFSESSGQGFVVGGDVVAVCSDVVEAHLGIDELVLNGVIGGESCELSYLSISVVDDRGNCVDIEELTLKS